MRRQRPALNNIPQRDDIRLLTLQQNRYAILRLRPRLTLYIWRVHRLGLQIKPRGLIRGQILELDEVEFSCDQEKELFDHAFII